MSADFHLAGAATSSIDWDPRRTAEIQEQLKRLGANYMLLERIPGQSRYRFDCRVEMSNNSIYTRIFEATDERPQRAMERVLADVSMWRKSAGSGRQHIAESQTGDEVRRQ